MATLAIPVLGIRNPAMTLRYGTITIKFKVNNKFDETGGKVITQTGKCSLEDKNRNTVGHGILQRQLYLMDAETIYPAKANLASATKKTWDHWHQKFRHISQKSLEKLAKNRMVEGFTIDQWTMPSTMCEACIQAKQSQKPYSKEAKNRSKTPGERIMSDVWGPTRIELNGIWKLYISFIDNCT